MVRLALALLALVGCADEINGPAADPASKLDEAVFRCSIEPILARQCSYTGCHGKASSPLRVYSPGKLRATPPADIDAQAAPLTDDEQHGNFTSAAGFASVATVADSFLLRKPLPARDGGFEHEGGAIYTGSDDPQYVAIAAWLAGTGTCP